VKIRNVALEKDLPELQRIFASQGLPMECFPDLYTTYQDKPVVNPRYVVKKVVEAPNGTVALAGFVKITSEAFLLLDHEVESPDWRWEALQELVEEVSREARIKGVDVITAFVPHHLIKSFGPRLESMKFMQSPWKSYSRLL
jgi:hypothetical protein